MYANDTVIMIDGSEKPIRNMKLILYWFEWLSRLKSTFTKVKFCFWGSTGRKGGDDQSAELCFRRVTSEIPGDPYQ